MTPTYRHTGLAPDGSRAHKAQAALVDPHLARGRQGGRLRDQNQSVFSAPRLRCEGWPLPRGAGEGQPVGCQVHDCLGRDVGSPGEQAADQPSGHSCHRGRARRRCNGAILGRRHDRHSLAQQAEEGRRRRRAE